MSRRTSLASRKPLPRLHAPPHRLAQAGVYFLTDQTLNQIHHFATPDRRTFLQECLFALAEKYGWMLEAWAVLTNHYHFVVQSPDTIYIIKGDERSRQ